MTYYKGNQYGNTPGILPGPPPQGDYYWWEGGALWGTLIDYWHSTVRWLYLELKIWWMELIQRSRATHNSTT
jgi:hypothetical protein